VNGRQLLPSNQGVDGDRLSALRLVTIV